MTTAPAGNNEALNGLRVLDVTQVLAGPFASQMLADFGADVIKIEPPITGDASRKALGFSKRGPDTAGFMAVNRNKRSCTINLKTEEGRQAFYALVRKADVVIENYRPGVTQRLGIDYDTLSAINPRIICASISGFGQTGPYATRPAHDLIAQGMAGVMSVTGEIGGKPVKAGPPIADLSAALYLVSGILTAVVARGKTGRGQYVETSIFEALLSLGVFESTEVFYNGTVPGPLGSTNRTTAPNQALATSDGYINVCVSNQKLWAALCAGIERPDLENDPRFVTNMLRIEHQPELELVLEEILITRPTLEWVDILLEVGVPCGPILDYRQAFEDPHVVDRGLVVEMDHPAEGRIRAIGVPLKMSGTPPTIRSAAPLLGAHTDEVLAEAGYGADAIAHLRDIGAI